VKELTLTTSALEEISPLLPDYGQESRAGKVNIGDHEGTVPEKSSGKGTTLKYTRQLN